MGTANPHAVVVEDTKHMLNDDFKDENDGNQVKDISEQDGIIPRALKDLFQLIQNKRESGIKVDVSVSYLEILNEEIRYICSIYACLVFFCLFVCLILIFRPHGSFQFLKIIEKKKNNNHIFTNTPTIFSKLFVTKKKGSVSGRVNFYHLFFFFQAACSTRRQLSTHHSAELGNGQGNQFE
jgi:hypothetical protein